MKHRFSFFSFILSAAFFSGCSNAYYESKPLESIKTKPKVEEKVAVFYRPLSKKESKAYLGRVWQRNGYQPVQVVIENYSDSSIRFVRKGISMPTEDLQIIKEKAHSSTKLKVLVVGAPSIASISMGLIGLALSPATFGVSGILLPIAVGGTGVHTASTWIKADLKLDKDYEEKFLTDKEIDGGAIHEGIIFVPKEDFSDKFRVKIFDTKHERLIVVQAKKFKG
jgi:hypothetical protein